MKDKKVVIQLIPWICEGGAETLVKDYSICLDRNKFDIHVLTTLMSMSTSSNLQQILNAKIDILSPYKWGTPSKVEFIIHRLKKIFVSSQKEEQKRAELEFKQQQAKEELEFKKEQSEKELEFKKEQAKNDLEFKKEQAEEEKKARKWDILTKIGIAIIPVIISSIFTVIVVKITCSENRKTLMATMLANEILERAGEISNVTAKDVAKEALKQATNVKIK